MAPSSVGGLGLLTLLAATSIAIPIAPASSLTERATVAECIYGEHLTGTWWKDCLQLVPAVTLPPAASVWRRDEIGTEGLDAELDSTHDNEGIVHPRDDVMHYPTSDIYTVNSGSGGGSRNVPAPSNNDQASGSEPNQPGGVVPVPKPVGVPRITLPVEKPKPMVRRREHTHLDLGGIGLGADLVTHSRADALWRRNDMHGKGDGSQNTEQTHPHPMDFDKSEAEQLFEQSKSANKMDSVEPKLITMHPAENLYRREMHDTPSSPDGGSRVPVEPQLPSSHQAEDDTDMKALDLTTLHPASGVYRRSQDVDSESQDDESQLMPPSRSPVLPLGPGLPRYRPRPVNSLPELYERDPSIPHIFHDIKDNIDRIKPVQGGDSAGGSDTASHQSSQSDSKSSPTKRSRPGKLDADKWEGEHPETIAPALTYDRSDEVYRRHIDAEHDVYSVHKRGRGDEPGQDDGERSGKPKYVALDRSKTVYRRSDRSLDDVMPIIPTPNAHERIGVVFKRGADDSAPDSDFSIEPGTVAGDLPVILGVAPDVHRREAEATPTSADAIRKRCYGQAIGASLCLLETAGTVYMKSEETGSVKQDRNEKRDDIPASNSANGDVGDARVGDERKKEKERKKEDKERKKAERQGEKVEGGDGA